MLSRADANLEADIRKELAGLERSAMPLNTLAVS